MVTVITVGGLIALLLLVGYGIYRLRRADLQVTELRTELAQYRAEQRMRSELLHDLLAPPQAPIPPKQRKPPKQQKPVKRPDYLKPLSVASTAVGSTAAAARDHAPAILAMVTVGGLLMLMPSHSPEGELPRPQIALPDHGFEPSPPLEPVPELQTPAPAPEPGASENTAPDTTEPEQQPPPEPMPAPAQTQPPSGTDNEPDTPPGSQPPEQEPREPPPEETEPEQPPSEPRHCLRVEVPPPDVQVDADACVETVAGHLPRVE